MNGFLGGSRRLSAIVGLVLLVGACGSGGGSGAGKAGPDATTGACGSVTPEQLSVEVVRTLEHDTDAFTQGLLVLDGALFESTGQVGRSTLRELDPDTGEVRRRVDVPPEFFAEGLAVDPGGRLVQLTWTDGVAIVWDPETFEELERFTYEGEGWGLDLLDDDTFVMSDGSDVLTRRDPSDFSVIDRRQVQRSDGPADALNELEWDGQWLWANRFLTDELVRIDLECATVTGVARLDELRRDAERVAGESGIQIDVVNGIAHLPGTDRYLLTGKYWPTMYEVRIVG